MLVQKIIFCTVFKSLNTIIYHWFTRFVSDILGLNSNVLLAFVIHTLFLFSTLQDHVLIELTQTGMKGQDSLVREDDPYIVVHPNYVMDVWKWPLHRHTSKLCHTCRCVKMTFGLERCSDTITRLGLVHIADKFCRFEKIGKGRRLLCWYLLFYHA